MHIISMIYIYNYIYIYTYDIYLSTILHNLYISTPFPYAPLPQEAQKPVEPGGAAGTVAPKKYAPWSGRGWHVTGVTSKKEGTTELK